MRKINNPWDCSGYKDQWDCMNYYSEKDPVCKICPRMNNFDWDEDCTIPQAIEEEDANGTI